MTARLEQARRIATLREQREERVRVDARRHQQECEKTKTEADQALMLQRREVESAEGYLLADPADPQTLVWREVSKTRQKEAETSLKESQEALSDACAMASEARAAHEKSRERSRIVADQIAQARRLMRAQQDERESEEIAEQRR